MKLLFVQDSLGTGGAERSNAELWKYLRDEKGAQIKIVVLEHRKVGIEREIIEHGFDVEFLSDMTFFHQVLELKKIIRDFDPDIVHSVLFRSVIRVRTARSLVKFTHVESIVNCSYAPVRYKDPKINSWGLSFYKRVNMITQGMTDYFVPITEEVKKHAIEHLKISPSKIKVIPRGRSENPFRSRKDQVRLEIISELGLDPQSILIAHVGRQEFQKGHIQLLRAIEKVDESLFNLQVCFLFCGRKGNATKEIEEFLSSRNIMTKILWLSHRDDVNRILAASDVFVFPSYFEGLGGALIEAQAAGLPIICTDIPVFEEVVVRDQNALFFTPSDNQELGEHLVFLAKSPEKRKEMSNYSIQNYQNKFKIEQVHEKMYTLYKSFLS